MSVATARAASGLTGERLRLYHSGKWSAIVGQAAVGLLLLWVLRAEVSAGAAWAWSAMVVAALALRALCDAGFRGPRDAAGGPGAAADAPRRAGAAELAELRRTRATVIAMGAAFGAGSVLVFPSGNFQLQVYFGFMMAGLAAGALTLTSFDLRFALAYAALVLVPFIVRLVEAGGAPALGIAGAAAMFVLYLALAGLRAHRNLIATVAVRQADARRTASLIESQARLQQATGDLTRATEELRLTFQHMDQGIFCLGPDGRTTFYNRRMCELTGLPESFMATRPTGIEITRFQAEQGHLGGEQLAMEQGVRERLRRHAAGEAWTVERYLRRTHAGRVLAVETVPLPGGGFLRTFSDVTALVEANERLRESEAEARKLALVASHTDDAVIITDPERRIEWVNEAFTRLTGYALAEVAGRRTSEFLRGPGTDMTSAQHLDERLQREQRAAGEILHYRKDGSCYWFALETRAVTDAQGAVRIYIGVGRDVTARRASEEALRAARDEAERASRAKSEFLSSMSHELRTPLNAILGFAQVLEADGAAPLPSRQREQVARIREAGTHLLELINDVLDLARVEAGREVLQVEPVLLAPLVDECLVLMRPLADARGIDLGVEHGGGEVPAVRADRTRLKQVLLNLLANAIKYDRPGGRVRVRLLASGGPDVRAEVSDTGPGLDAEAQRRLFTPFERLGAERGPIEGAGIGLALSQRLMSLMHGRVEVRSEPGLGSTFAVVLPRAEVPVPGAEVAAAATREAAAAAIGAAKVLYIEDNEVNAVLVQSMLAMLPGVHLMVSSHPASGLAIVHAERPDLVLLDIQLPDMDGYEVLRRLRADEATRQIPVIAISANAMRGDIERGLAAGFDDYLTKPLELGRLHAAVRLALGAVRDRRSTSASSPSAGG